MRASRRLQRASIVVPVLAGIGLLAGGSLLLPGRREVMYAERRAQPPMRATTRPPAITAAVVSAPVHATLAAAIPVADAQALAALTAKLAGEGQGVSTLQVAHDLVAAGRPPVALAYIAARPDADAPAVWPLRIDLLRRTGRVAEAASRVAEAARGQIRGQGPGRIAAADLIAAAYAIDRADLIVAAAASGAVPPPDRALALDLARRAEQAGRFDLIAALDRATRADWRAADPWLAIRIASRTHDTAAGLRAAALLPADRRDAAREAILTVTGDRAALRTLLLARAATRPDAIAERLLAADYRDDAIAVLRRAVSTGSPSTPTAHRLLYLMGPRPAAADLAWLREQTLRGSAADRMAWIAAYAARDRPAQAAAFLAGHPLAERTEVMLARLSLARADGNDAAGRSLAAGLLDGRRLDAGQIRALSASVPDRIDPAQSGTLARARIAAGIAGTRDRLDLAWSAWNAGDSNAAAGWLDQQLAASPDDLAALRLMADVQGKLGGVAAARPWLERALAQALPNSRPRAELLDRLGRKREAVALVKILHTGSPGDPSLAALHARLLIAQGRPGRARAILAE